MGKFITAGIYMEQNYKCYALSVDLRDHQIALRKMAIFILSGNLKIALREFNIAQTGNKQIKNKLSSIHNARASRNYHTKSQSEGEFYTTRRRGRGILAHSDKLA